MKILIGLVGLLLLGAVPAIADDAADTPGVAERKSCVEIKTEMDALSGQGDLDENQTADLENLRTMYRRTCMQAAAGRRTSGRVASIKPAAPIVAADDTHDLPAPADDASSAINAIDEFLAKKKENCVLLMNQITKLSQLADDKSKDTVAALQSQYDADCAEKAVTENVAPKSDAERAAEIAKLIQDGFCADGTKPNKFGCCGDEKFTDMGDLVFACCPAEGDCYPPIK